jgi:WD40 repeat protein
VWNLADGAELRTLHRHDARVNSVAVSPDGQWIVSGSDDCLIKVWDLTTGSEVRVIKGHEAKVNTVVIEAKGTYLYSASSDFTVKAWDLASGQLLATYTADSTMLACTTGQDGMVVAGDQTGRVHFLHLDRPAASGA